MDNTDIIERREGYVEVALIGQRQSFMEKSITGLSDDMKEFRSDVSELKVGASRSESKLDTLIEMNGKFIDKQEIENKKNYHTRLILKWLLGLPAIGAGVAATLKLLLSKATWAKLLASLSL